MKLIAVLFLLISLVNAQDKYTTIKTSCIQQSEHSGKSLDQLKQILLGQAKQEALGELYGQLMYSKTDLVDGKIMSDNIRQRAIGSVRVQGNPKFYNGSNFGSICADVTSYITKKDLEKYSPKKTTLHHYCFNDSTVAMKDIKRYAKFGAYKEIISKYKPSLRLSNEQAENFIHGFEISNDNFDFDTASYCFDAVATVLPYEFEVGGKLTKTNKKLLTTLSKGLVAHYEFEGNARDSSQNYNDGLVYGGVTYVAGVIGKAAKFDGTGKIEINDSNNNLAPKNITISGWIKRQGNKNGWGNECMILYKGKYDPAPNMAYSIQLTKNTYYLTSRSDSSGAKNIVYKENSIEINTWYYFTSIYDNTLKQHRFYINDKLINTVSFRNKINQNTERLTLASYGYNDGYFYNGLIDDLRIYNRVLTEKEIKALYQMGKK